MKTGTTRELARRLVKLIYADERHASMQPYDGLLLASHNEVTSGTTTWLTLTFNDGMGGDEQTVKRFKITEE